MFRAQHAADQVVQAVSTVTLMQTIRKMEAIVCAQPDTGKMVTTARNVRIHVTNAHRILTVLCARNPILIIMEKANAHATKAGPVLVCGPIPACLVIPPVCRAETEQLLPTAMVIVT